MTDLSSLVAQLRERIERERRTYGDSVDVTLCNLLSQSAARKGIEP